MNKREYKNIDYFIRGVISDYQKIKNCEINDLTIVANCYDTLEILNTLVSYDYPLYFLEYLNPEVDSYDKEYYISLNLDGIWCEKGFNAEHQCYLSLCETNVYILDDCNSKILQQIEDCNIQMVSISEEDDENDDDDDCCLDCGCCEDCCCEFNESYDADNNLDGFTYTVRDNDFYMSKSFYSHNKDLVTEIARRIAK